MPDIIWFKDLTLADVNLVGGKNASLGEMIRHLTQANIKVPAGFATTADSFQQFLKANQLDKKIQALLKDLDINDVNALAKIGAQIREQIMQADFSPQFNKAITQAYQQLGNDREVSVAVRSSATAEDLPDASFAGQQETFLNVTGIADVLVAIKKVYASLFNDRAISYRIHQGFDHQEVSISAGIQLMVRSDLAASGVMFSIDTESGFEQVVLITASYGLGEMVVQGAVNPDEFCVYKPALTKHQDAIVRRSLGAKQIKMIFDLQPNALEPVTTVSVSEAEQLQFCLSDNEVTQLAKLAVVIEQHYGRPMDIEWGKDGQTGELYILQARPETVQSRQQQQVIERYQLKQKGQVICSGRSIGQKIGQGKAKVLSSIADMDRINPGDVLVTDMTDPDWEPIMKRAAAIVTNRGGRTCHAAIIARELGIPAVVGCQDATATIKDDQEVTVSCAEGDTGYVYAGLLPFAVHTAELDKMPDIPFKIMLNVGNPERAFSFQRLPNFGVGLARLEFIINKMIGIHPQALLGFANLPNDLQQQIQQKISCYSSPKEYYIERLKEGIATIACAFYPKTVIVRLSDFKSNEYANLIGGKLFEPEEENPMLGFRGASRYVSEHFRPCFELECEAIHRVRESMGLTNVAIMIPFVRTLTEAKQVTELLQQNHLARGEHDLQVMMMCELPSNAVLAEDFLQYFDGFSIGSNDMTQLTLGLDRDSGIVANLFDERDPAVKTMLALAISAAKKAEKYIGICGQGPSDHPDLARWLINQGIESVSLNPDTVVDTWLFLANESQEKH